ncbi:hypothetical protein PINS_up019856 [Pythium insidiosum]|nr:hypothetical protein PINS_up019856 [Pythium insidiosum]
MAQALNSLIRMYKQWAYDLYPGLNFEDFIDRTEALGKTPRDVEDTGFIAPGGNSDDESDEEEAML